MSESFRIGFVCGKLGDVDGVSLEVCKWIEVLRGMGHEVHCIAGRFAQPLQIIPSERHHLLEKIEFNSPEQRKIEEQVFPHFTKRPFRLSSKQITGVVDRLESGGMEVAAILQEYIGDLGLDVLIAENTNAMPMTLLGGMGLYWLATRLRMAVIFHHHDFWWERSRFSNNYIEPLLNRIMPPTEPGLEHVVISSYAAHLLASLKRVQPYVIPNCEDFDSPPTLDDYNGDFRSQLGFSEEDVLVVQPTRIVPRKRIEDSIALLGMFLERNREFRGRLQYIVSLYQGDEPDRDYIVKIKRRADRVGVPLHLISDRVSAYRRLDKQGRKMYTNRDVLVNADLVTYLPRWEGFGNALLESIAARVPVVTTTYLVYKTDIMAAGMRNIEVRDRYDEAGDLVISDAVLEQIRTVLSDPTLAREMTEHNFQTARREFGLEVLDSKLRGIFSDYSDEIRASRRRIVKSMASYSV